MIIYDLIDINQSVAYENQHQNVLLCCSISCITLSCITSKSEYTLKTPFFNFTVSEKNGTTSVLSITLTKFNKFLWHNPS